MKVDRKRPWTNRIVLIFILGCANMQVFAQPQDPMANGLQKGSLRKHYKLAKNQYLSGEYVEALETCQAALKKSSKRKKVAKLSHLAGNAASALRDYSMAEYYLNKCLDQQLDKKKYDLAYFHLAQSLNYQAKYDEAKQWYGKFIHKAENNESLSVEKSKARIASKGCTYAIEYSIEEPLFAVKNPGDNVNGPYAEFGPELRGEELVYSKIKSKNSSEFNDHLAKLYVAQLDELNYEIAQEFSSILNQNDEYICNPSFSTDNKTLYFVKCTFVNRLEKRCAIYQSKLIDGIWAKPEILPEGINQENSSSSHPQLVSGLDGSSRLYFTSNRKEGRGGTDIWYVEMNEQGEFGRPRNVGYPINTRFDETSPFYHSASNTLYYSSDGEIGFGGLDVFAVQRTDDGWSEPVNMGLPINSSLDDYDFILDDKEELGFLVSNRVGTLTETNPTCCDDIFEVLSTHIDLYVSANVYIETQAERMLSKSAQLILGDLNTGIVDSISIADGGAFRLAEGSNYRLIAKEKGFKATSIEFSTLGLVFSDSLLFDLFINEPDDFLGIIYYEFAESKLTAEAPVTLHAIIEFLDSHPKALIEVSAHTDNRGSAAFNLALSKERCEAAVNFLIHEGIDGSRISMHWYGETKPVAPNYLPDGSDNPEGRALNRRTEFKITN